MERYTIKHFNEQFPNDDTCLDFIKSARWPDGIRCVKCDRITPHFRVSNRKSYACQFCGSQVYPTADTIFHKSSNPLRSWFYAMFLMASTRTGVSAKQLEREIGVTYKTAWRMFNQIRKIMSQDPDLFLFGPVEIDETYIGGKEINKHFNKRLNAGRGVAGKTPAFGMVERGGKVVVKVTPNTKSETLIPIIQERIPLNETATIYTDEFPSYNQLSSLGYAHETVKHRAKEHVAGNAHTNNIEGIWSNTKRGIDGTHHAISPKHLQGYLDAYVFRYNHRHDTTPMFVQLLNQAVSALPSPAEMPA